MGDLTRDLAAAYAEAVLDVLAGEFPDLDETRLGSLGRLVKKDIAEQAADPVRSFEVIVTYTREWRLIQARGDDRWRVELVRYGSATAAEARREYLINEALRAINPATLDAAKENG